MMGTPAKPMATLKQVSEFFEYKKLSDFRTEWTALSAAEQTQIKVGIADGTLNY